MCVGGAGVYSHDNVSKVSPFFPWIKYIETALDRHATYLQL